MAPSGDEYRDGNRITVNGNQPIIDRNIDKNKECCMKKQMNGIALLLLGILFALAGGQLDILGLTGIGLVMGIFGAGLVYWNSGKQ